jgi:hypothetical protein
MLQLLIRAPADILRREAKHPSLLLDVQLFDN